MHIRHSSDFDCRIEYLGYCLSTSIIPSLPRSIAARSSSTSLYASEARGLPTNHLICANFDVLGSLHRFRTSPLRRHLLRSLHVTKDRTNHPGITTRSWRRVALMRRARACRCRTLRAVQGRIMRCQCHNPTSDRSTLPSPSHPLLAQRLLPKDHRNRVCRSAFRTG